jgi:hypothetical protein
VKYAFIDTGTSLMYVSDPEFEVLVSHWSAISGVDCSSGACSSTTKTCAEIWPDMKNLTIRLDQVEYTIPPQGLTIDFDPSQMYYEKCYIAVGA